MSGLHKLQTDFLDGLFFDKEDIYTKIRETDDIKPERRLNVYRNNVFVIIKDALKADFPATVALGSEGFFDYMAHQYVLTHPPQSGDLNVYGAGFSGFLRQSEAIKNHPFLGDVAALEWAQVETAQRGVDIQIESDYPVLQLWKLGMGQATPEDINMDVKETVTIRQEKGKIVMYVINDKQEKK